MEKNDKVSGKKGPLSSFWLLRQSALDLICTRSPTLNTRTAPACNPWRRPTVPRQLNGGGKSQISPLKAVLNLGLLVSADPCNQFEIVEHVQPCDRHLNGESFPAQTEEKILHPRDDSEAASTKACKLMFNTCTC